MLHYRAVCRELSGNSEYAKMRSALEESNLEQKKREKEKVVASWNFLL